MSDDISDKIPNVIPRAIEEGFIPLVAVEGSAYECGRQYGQIVREKYPNYNRYLLQAKKWNSTSQQVKKIFEKKAPYIIEILAGLLENNSDNQRTHNADIASPNKHNQFGCTSFSVSGTLTLDGYPISGQTKDTIIESVNLYIALRMRITNGPTILVLAYPGEILGYGFWSTGMSLFRNALHSSADSEGQLAMWQWGLLALASNNIEEAIELAKEFGITGSGNCLITDSSGNSVNVEFNKGGLNFIPDCNGINVHANHPVGPDTSTFERYPDIIEKENSRLRMKRLYELLKKEQGRITAQKALAILADHKYYPRGICRHIIGQNTKEFTTAVVIAEPAKGKLHLVKGNPCCNWPVTYTL